MRRRFTFLLAALLLTCSLSWAQTRAEVVAYTLDGTITGGSNGYATESEITQNDITWMVTANTEINPWRFGGKSLDGVDRPMYSTDRIADNITKVVVTNGTATATVNSMTLIVSADADFSNPTSTIAGEWAASATTTFERPADADWTNKYFKLVYNVTVEGTSNKYAQFVNAKFYKEEGSVSAPSITASNVEIAYNATSGEIAYTINNPVQGGVLSAATDAEWLTIGTIGEAVPFTCLANEGAERIASVTLTYTYGNENATKSITVTQAANPNGPGSEYNPYTVAQARAAIDANAGTQGVYATGIVSAIPTAWSTQYNNITFNFVDEQGDEEFLQAYRCVSTDNVDASTVAVGDIVVVYGNLTYYEASQTYEFASGCQLVSLTHPTTFIAAPTFAPEGGTYLEPQAVTITCETEGVDIYYTLDGSDPTLDSDMYENPITVNETTTIKAIAVDADENTSSVATAIYTIIIPTYAELPFEFNGGKEDIDGTDGLYQEGLGSDYSSSPKLKFDHTGDWVVLQFDEEPGVLEFDIKGNSFSDGTFTVQGSVPGGTYNDLKTYTDLGSTETETIDLTDYPNIRYIRWIYTEKVNGNVALGNIKLAKPAAEEHTITATPNTINVDADEHSEEIEVFAGNWTEFAGAEGVAFYDVEGNLVNSDPEWLSVNLNVEPGYPYNVTIAANDGAARSAYFKFYANDEGVMVYSNLVTVNQAAYVAPTIAVLPFIWEGGSSADFAVLDGVTMYGNGSDYNPDNHSPYLIKLDGTGDYIEVHTDSQPGIVTIGVKMIGGGNTSTITVKGSTDGETFDEGEALTISGAQNDIVNLTSTRTFDEDVRYVRLYFTKGSNVGVGPITIAKPVTNPVITVSPATVDATAEGGNGALTVTYQNITDITASVFFCDAEGGAATYNWITAEVNDDDNVEYTINANDGEARTAYLKVKVGETYSNLVTINQAAYVAPPTPGEWVLTSLADLNENDVFVIVGDNGSTYAMSNDNGTSAAPAAVAVTVVDNTLSGEIAANLQWNISITDDGYIFYPNSETETWLYCTNTNNGVRVGTNENNVFTLSQEGYLVNAGTSRYIGIYNSQDWRCYTSINNNIAGQTFAFYKKVTSSQTTTQTVALSAGWNWISCNVEVTLADLQTALVEAMPGATVIKIFAQNGDNTSYLGNGRWRGTLTSLDLAQMYMIQTDANGTMTLTGNPVNPADHPVTIVNGVNYFGFPLSSSMTLSDAFNGFATSGDKVLSQEGQSSYLGNNRWRGDVTSLEPGKGYIYMSESNESRTLVFPNASK